MQQIMHILAEHLINALVSQSAETRRVAERASVFEINSVNGFGDGVEKKSQFLLALAEFLFCPLSIRDIYIDADDACSLAELVHKNLPAPCDPMNAPVSPDYPPFTLSWLSAFHRGVSQLDDSCAVIGVNEILECRLCLAKATGLQAVHYLQFRCPSVHACPDIPFKTADASNLLPQSQPFLTCA
jgi:hypothetical protein